MKQAAHVRAELAFILGVVQEPLLSEIVSTEWWLQGIGHEATWTTDGLSARATCKKCRRVLRIHADGAQTGIDSVCAR